MTDTTHRVTAVEPVWVKQEYEPNEKGDPQPVSEPESMEIIDLLFQESTYECSCGVELEGWQELEVHFASVSEDAS